jgi:hypothetical protein
VLTELLDTGDDDDRWAAAAAAAGLHVDDLDVIGLRDLLRRPGDANLFASIGARYL